MDTVALAPIVFDFAKKCPIRMVVRHGGTNGEFMIDFDFPGYRRVARNCE